MSVPSSRSSGQSTPSRRDDFTVTHWTQVVLAANQDGSAQARQALEALCVRYWPAIYSFLRGKNYGPDDAADLTQGFFSHLLEENAIVRADRSKGRFRNFLLGALQRFLVDDQRRNSAQKRGRGRVGLALDFPAMEECYLEEADPGLTPDQLYDRRWAATVLETAFAELQAEFREADQSLRFDYLQRFLSEEASDGDYAAGAAQLGITAKAVSSAVSRLRERYRELVRRTVLATVSGPEEIDPEFRELFR
ncbi:MAG: sigma-70 family RNA polymerase sigma factor [Verrucomicrobiales bacterium]|nr:sigma-70 family RNA polymerase sigma factor [Verrucomicrobiales bacterium]